MNMMMAVCSSSKGLAGSSDAIEWMASGIFAIVLAWMSVKFAARRKWMLALGGVIALLGFAIYMWPGIFNVQEMSHGILAAFSKSVSAFYPSRGGYEENFEMSAWYWLFHSMAIVYVSMIVLVLFAGEFMNWGAIFLRKFRNRVLHDRPINVFWGYSAEAKALAQNLDEGTDSVVFVMPESRRLWFGLNDDEGVHEMAKAGWKWVTREPTARKYLSHERRHFFVGPDCHANIVEAQTLLRDLIDSGYGGKMTIYVRMWPEAENDAVYKWVDAWNGKIDRANSGIEIVVVREESIVSRKFLVDHPMLECPGVGVTAGTAAVTGKFNVLVVGFGVQGERLMGDMICDAQFLDVQGRPIPISVDVIDKDVHSFGRFKANCQDACARYNINFETYDVHSTGFWDWLKNDLRPRYNRIVICTQDDMTNLELANEIANWYVQTYKSKNAELKDTIFARVRRSSLVKGLTGSIEVYRLFGDMQDTYSARWLLKDKWDAGAIFVNGIWSARYDKDKPKDESALEWYKANECRGVSYWRRQSMFNKESSRASFLHMRNILRLIGYVARPYRPSNEEILNEGLSEITRDQITELKSCMLTGEQSQALAASEHMRWMAFHLVRGWKKWTPTEEELETLSNGGTKMVEPNSMKYAYIHANLVDFDELDALDEIFNAVNRKNNAGIVDSKKKDDDIVFGLEAVFAAGFFVAQKPSR